MIANNLLRIPNSTPFPFPIPRPHPPIHRSRQKLQPKPWLLPHCHSLKNLTLLHSEGNPDSQVRGENGGYGGGLFVDADDLAGRDELRSPVELSVTRTLPAAVTLRAAVERMKEAVEKLRSDPPCSRSGVVRFQVAVPPSTKALNWLCCQQLSLRVFPQFCFIREQIHGSPHELTLANGACGVSGVGVAVYFHSSSSQGYNLMSRYLSIDSDLITAYGLIGISYNRTSSLIEKKSGSSCYFIPQIELSEFESFSFIASTLVWDNSLSFTFGEAVQCLEKCLQQLSYIPPIKMNYQDMWRKNISGDLEMNTNAIQMVNLDAKFLSQVNAGAKCLQLEEMPTCDQYIFRHSATVSISTYKFASPCAIRCSIKEASNINLVWASLIVEECVRLGLTYFCVAPGSRSSPLALAACNHSLTTCVSCFDERSLAFHAVGYGKGSHKPAIVITSSGTAVSNLLPALTLDSCGSILFSPPKVVEASHDCVPLMLLTADRPPELLDTGANQAIDQINHFGNFVRFFFSLPPPTDQIPARIVLTTIDSATYRATQEPFGPVHINCPFREPLEDHPKEWTLNCLNGLELWMSKAEPFTKYIKMKFLPACNDFLGEVTEVLDIIQNANKGLLLIGAIHTEDEIWAALLLAKHLLWPVVTDVLSGLRLRRVLSSLPNYIDEDFLFIDHMDQILLSESVKKWALPDVVVQIGSKITSKRINQLLEHRSPSPYILVDKHPFRQDPSHIVTHRIQSTIIDFADVICTTHIPRKPSRWSFCLKALDKTVAQEILFLIQSEFSLTEPHVARVIAEASQYAAALFVGNSMVIRDVDMYGGGWINSSSERIHLMSKWGIQFHGIQVSGNRGASGIDGLLSTAIGFAVGSNKKVLCVIGDVSFLHDTNGLAILSQRTRRKPMTIIVINNHGGAIFSLLPIAERTPSDVLNQYFYTSHDISVLKLCSAHSVKHLLVRTKSELQQALEKSQKDQSDCVIEVKSCIADNARFHRIISKFVGQAAEQALHVLLGLPFSEKILDSLFVCKIKEINYSSYRIELCAPLTSTNAKDVTSGFYREGFILTISLDNGSTGFGEIAPIEIHKEDLLDVEEQLRFLVHAMEGSKISYILPLIEGSFSHWIWRSLGIPPSSLFPSVRCGMEMALLNAIAAGQDSCLSDLLAGCNITLQDTRHDQEGTIMKRPTGVQICALIDCDGSPKEVAHVVSQLVNEGFNTIKLKVARRKNPIEDVLVIQEIRQLVGYQINIRADANRRWTYEDACQFGFSVKSYDLQYIEEPVCSEDDIIRFCEETGLPVALDETVDHIGDDLFHKLKGFRHPGIVAIVIKPSVVGGFEKASVIAKWAQLQGKMSVISSTFESSLGLASYVQFAHYLERQNVSICKMQNRELRSVTAHGLGTYKWLKDDVTRKTLKVCVSPLSETMEASVKDADVLLRRIQINHGIIQRVYKGEEVRSYRLTIDGEVSYCVKVIEAGVQKNNKVIVFLHGFLGTSREWIPVMNAMSATTRCISVDLPGHGNSQPHWHITKESKQKFDISVESVADILMKLICRITKERVILVGYSMGARIALNMVLKYNKKVDGAVIISGSPGLRDEVTRRIRATQDEAKAQYLMTHGLVSFLETWYAGKLWDSLRDHPHFMKIVESRANHNDVQALAQSLSGLSIGRQISLWEDLKNCTKPLLFVVGEKDTKFKDISRQMCAEMSHQGGEIDRQDETLCEMIVVPDSGHAVHLENPLPVINAVSRFLTRVYGR